ncbi:endoribonuclease YbeY-like isoform X1 [Leucoraja erinacea]|uniref:endoribonuclease YbeY-like isoform X1 n=1 Tax=Leucoraja erinaceus TaxID=7782 RepID=UPI0024584577|nr:endoribonuclease YbeY-like isoform X1 [Leucoraja erinacea]
MALVIRNLQRAVPLRRARLRRDCQVLRQILGLGHFDLGLICVDNQRMRILNGRYREQEAATDVLSFPFHQDLRPGDIPKLLHQDEYNLGDIFLGVEYIHKQSQVYGQDFYNVLTVTTLHGICHLLGYMHNTETEWKQMFQREFNTLQMFNILTGASLKPLTQNIFSTHT